jgi:hypothetical protein
MWIGRRPAAMAPVEHPAGTEAFATAVTGACAGAGCEVQDYVAAAGAYGSWLIRFTQAGRRQRLVWNGKEGRLVLEEATSGPAWRELASNAVSGRNQEEFVAAIRNILGGQDHVA